MSLYEGRDREDREWIGELAERLREQDRKLDHIIAQNRKILNEQGVIEMDLTELTNQVTNAVTVEESAVTLLNSIGAQLIAAAGDPAAVAALGEQLQTGSADLAAAIVANTPAAPAQ